MNIKQHYDQNTRQMKPAKKIDVKEFGKISGNRFKKYLPLYVISNAKVRLIFYYCNRLHFFLEKRL